MISFREFVEIYESVHGEPEFEIFFSNTEKSYMIIKYDDHVSFQRCGSNDGSGEYDYSDIQELYSENLVDGICLKEAWNNIITIIVNATFDLSLREDREEFLKVRG